jgi:hypothetical protein
MTQQHDVPFSDDSEEVTDDQLDTSGNSPEDKATRLEKRRERAAERERERKETGERLVRLEAELAAERAERARLAGYVQATVQPKAGPDPYQQRLDAVYAKQSDTYRAYVAETLAAKANKQELPAERQAYFDSQARQFEEAKADIISERAVARVMPTLRQESSQQTWVQRYPDVWNNPQALKYAQATWEQKKAMGLQETHELADEVYEEARRVFKLGGKPSPSSRDREKLSGVPAAGGGGGAPATGDIQMTRDLRLMAIAKYSDLPEDKAIAKWKSVEGKALRLAKVL